MVLQHTAEDGSESSDEDNYTTPPGSTYHPEPHVEPSSTKRVAVPSSGADSRVKRSRKGKWTVSCALEMCAETFGELVDCAFLRFDSL